MKIKCSLDDLRWHLKRLSLVESKAILINADSSINLTAIDRVSMSVSCSGEILETGKAALSCSQLLSLANKLLTLAKEVTLSVNNGFCSIKTDTGLYRLQCLEESELPELSDVPEWQKSYTLNAKQLSEAINSTIYSASTDATKCILCGVNLQIENNILAFATTDGHRLSLIKFKDDYQNSKLSITLPNRLCLVLQKLLNKDLEIKLLVDSKQENVCLQVNDYKITSNLLTGFYPIYQKLIPTEFETRLTIATAPLLEAVEKILVISSQKNGFINIELNCDNQVLILTSQVTDVGVSEIVLPAQVDGNLKIGFYGNYLLDALKNIKANEIMVSLVNSRSPVIIEPLTSQKLIYLVMPVYVKE